MLSAEERMQGIGASESAATAGLHPWLSHEKLLRRKLVLEPEEDKYSFWWGHGQEDFVRRTLEEKPHFIKPRPPKVVEVLGEMPTKWHREIPWAFATPDGKAILETGENVLLEIKTAAIKRDEGWGPAGTDQIPAHYACQVLWSMAVLNSHVAMDLAIIRRAWVLALFGNREPQLFEIPFDADRAAWLFETAGEFWKTVLEQRKRMEAA